MVLPALLAHCARVSLDGHQTVELASLAHRETDWDGLVSAAEMHGLSPLLHSHLRAANIRIPDGARYRLLALARRHRRGNQVRLQALGDILDAFGSRDIPVLVLKGAALASLVYPDPALRPMTDLDLLLRARDLERAEDVLAELDFRARPTPGVRWDRHHHRPPRTRATDGMEVVVELHRDVFDYRGTQSLAFERAWARRLRMPSCAVEAYALGHEEMLLHLAHHLASTPHRFRLIGVADIVGLASRFESEIDWDLLRREYGFVMSTLALLHHLAPLPEPLQQRVGPSGHAPRGVGIVFDGWPQSRLADAALGARCRFVFEAYTPSEWWLRLNQGLGSWPARIWPSRVRHALWLTGLTVNWAGYRVRRLASRASDRVH